MRWIRQKVLPAPGPAMTSSGPERGLDGLPLLPGRLVAHRRLWPRTRDRAHWTSVSASSSSTCDWGASGALGNPERVVASLHQMQRGPVAQASAHTGDQIEPGQTGHGFPGERAWAAPPGRGDRRDGCRAGPADGAEIPGRPAPALRGASSRPHRTSSGRRTTYRPRSSEARAPRPRAWATAARTVASATAGESGRRPPASIYGNWYRRVATPRAARAPRWTRENCAACRRRHRGPGRRAATRRGDARAGRRQRRRQSSSYLSRSIGSVIPKTRSSLAR